MLYLVYETSRGLAAGDRTLALHHATKIIQLERSLHAFHERGVQHLLATLHLLTPLGLLYLLAHPGGTLAVLAWLHRRRAAAFVFTRTTLILASLLSLLGYALFPTAPPRMVSVGIVDTVSQVNHVDLDHGLISSLYNPFAAVPSMHFGYALLIGAVVVHEARSAVTKAAAALYPPLVLLVIVATGNHFFFDAAAGAAVITVAATLAAFLHATATTCWGRRGGSLAPPSPTVLSARCRPYCSFPTFGVAANSRDPVTPSPTCGFPTTRTTCCGSASRKRTSRTAAAIVWSTSSLPTARSPAKDL